MTNHKRWPEAYGALRTPHFYVFNEERKLVYTGRELTIPGTRQKMTVNNLDLALEELTSGDLFQFLLQIQ